MNLMQKILTTREQYIVAQVGIAFIRSVNSLHSASGDEKESVNEDVHCIDKIACNIANEVSLGAIDQTINLLQRLREIREKNSQVVLTYQETPPSDV